MASIIPPASEISIRVNNAIAREIIKQKTKIKNQVDKIIADIATVINNLENEVRITTEYFVDMGDMNEPDIDYDLCKNGAVIKEVCEALGSAGYFTKVYEGKFKQKHRYGTFITISLEPIPSDEY